MNLIRHRKSLFTLFQAALAFPIFGLIAACATNLEPPASEEVETLSQEISVVSPRTVCKNSPIPAGHVIESESSSTSCPNSGFPNQWILKEVVDGQEYRVCASSPIPSGYVVLEQYAGAGCPKTLGPWSVPSMMKIGKPRVQGDTEVCPILLGGQTSPPAAYVISEINYPSACYGGYSWMIEAASGSMTVCNNSPVPAGYEVTRTWSANTSVCRGLGYPQHKDIRPIGSSGGTITVPPPPPPPTTAPPTTGSSTSAEQLPVPRGHFRLKNRWTGEYLGVSSLTSMVGRIQVAPFGVSDPKSYWSFSESGGYARFSSSTPKGYANIQNLNGSVEYRDVPEGYWSSQWTLEKSEGYVRIRNRWYPGVYAHVENRKGFLEYGEISSGHHSSHWILEPVAPQGKFRLKDRWTGNYLGVSPSGDSVKVAQFLATDPSSHWSFENMEGGFSRLVNQGTSAVMHVEDRLGTVQLGVVPLGFYSAQWIFQQNSEGYARFQNRWLGSHAHIEDRLGLLQYGNAPEGWYSSQWTLEPAPVLMPPLPNTSVGSEYSCVYSSSTCTLVQEGWIGGIPACGATGGWAAGCSLPDYRATTCVPQVVGKQRTCP